MDDGTARHRSTHLHEAPRRDRRRRPSTSAADPGLRRQTGLTDESVPPPSRAYDGEVVPRRRPPATPPGRTTARSSFERPVAVLAPGLDRRHRPDAPLRPTVHEPPRRRPRHGAHDVRPGPARRRDRLRPDHARRHRAGRGATASPSAPAARWRHVLAAHARRRADAAPSSPTTSARPSGGHSALGGHRSNVVPGRRPGSITSNRSFRGDRRRSSRRVLRTTAIGSCSRWCSPGRDRSGIIAEATLRLVPAPTEVQVFYDLVYTGARPDAWPTSQFLIEDARFDQMEAWVFQTGADTWAYLLEAIAYHGPGGPPDDAALLDGLHHVDVAQGDLGFLKTARPRHTRASFPSKLQPTITTFSISSCAAS